MLSKINTRDRGEKENEMSTRRDYHPERETLSKPIQQQWNQQQQQLTNNLNSELSPVGLEEPIIEQTELICDTNGSLTLQICTSFRLDKL